MIKYTETVERWGVFEACCEGSQTGNPFIDHHIEGKFIGENETVTVDGFYDGDGIYIVRFMPSYEGLYTYEIYGDFSEQSYQGEFTVTKAANGNHGPVRVANTYHFTYEDGTPYYSVGTTCYVWELQEESLQKKTLETLKENAFNKIRFCVFPKHYDYNLREPYSYPYIGTPCDSSVLTSDNFLEYNGAAEGNDWDFSRFNPAYFRHIEECIKRLGDLGIEADLIIMHPYDRWGFSLMNKEQDDLYWRYVVARFAAYHNVWWSLANEYDILKNKTEEDWERYAKILCEKDPYGHLRSIHNCIPFYDYSKPWVTHCSMQRQDVYKGVEYVDEYREKYKKPIVMDEIAYEGNIQHGWGNISGQELVRRFWEATCRGGYAGHGETYLNDQDILWWSHGGVLHGDSPKRFQFLYKIVTETPGLGLAPIKKGWDEVVCSAESTLGTNDYLLYYYGVKRPGFREFYFDDTTTYQVDVIDTWNMTIENRGNFTGNFKINLPGREYMAIRIKKIN